MKKKIFLMFSAVILLVTLTIVNVSAGMHISTDWNGTSPTITFTNGTDGVASYVHQNSFYEDQNCFSIYSRVSYSSWYQGIAGEMVDPYCNQLHYYLQQHFDSFVKNTEVYCIPDS